MVSDIRLQRYMNRNESLWRDFSDNQKTVEKEDDIIAILSCMQYCYKAYKYY